MDERELPPAARTIDPALAEVGAGMPHQQVVFAQVVSERKEAVVIARLVGEHPEGHTGSYYGVRLGGVVLRGMFRPWSVASLGEMRWDPAAGWTQVAVGATPA